MTRRGRDGMTRFDDAQRRGISHSVRHGVPLAALAVGWDTSEATLLRIAGISRDEHELRRVLRVAACRRGLDTDEADREVAAAVSRPGTGDGR
jgi:hypothetical protein